MEERKRSLALIVAALTCPCHLALLSALAAGTALGAMLQAHLGWFFAGVTLVFLGALAVAFRRPQEPAIASCKAGGCGADELARRDPPGSQTHEREDSWQAAAR